MRPNRSRSRFLYHAAFFVTLAACGAGSNTACTGSSGELGQCCDQATTCGEGLECLPPGAIGVCTRQCLGSGDCPGKAACILIESKSQGQLGRYCLLRCGEEYPECPAGRCTATNDPQLSVCLAGL
ncbi:MAG: hypothetical protein D6806_16400 [Deltaproteobacteria bacterium]|nr:MAG: hypothetical protein D6806_16400 [Deltaproteobacteria bacterium]